MKQIKIAAAAAVILVLWATAIAQTAAFRFNGPLSRVLTPNSDGRNDVAIFCFDNFSDSDVEGKIFSLLGAEVARLELRRLPTAGCPLGNLPQHMIWNARSNGSIVSSGIYVYQIKAEGLSFTGSLVVVR
ncbi:MAG: hypothetical protein A3J74_08675 [Elusimicrobia bacterium RIFCSPHIGHO2_02_FULL_57_9]|nr:MAG: hypothetical protein A3J74_08675 [Elusimicrobia bacterium RIFCSPHIGHO2_02_FULL_57_9]